MVIHNEPRPPLPRDIGPDPLQEHAYAQTGLRQELEMHRGPGEPCEEPTEMDFAALQNGEALPTTAMLPLSK